MRRRRRPDRVAGSGWESQVEQPADADRREDAGGEQAVAHGAGRLTTSTEQGALCATRSLTLPSALDAVQAAAADDEQVGLVRPPASSVDRARRPRRGRSRRSHPRPRGRSSLPPCARRSARPRRRSGSPSREGDRGGHARIRGDPSMPTTIERGKLRLRRPRSGHEHRAGRLVRSIVVDAAERDPDRARDLMRSHRDEGGLRALGLGHEDLVGAALDETEGRVVSTSFAAAKPPGRPPRAASQPRTPPSRPAPTGELERSDDGEASARLAQRARLAGRLEALWRRVDADEHALEHCAARLEVDPRLGRSGSRPAGFGRLVSNYVALHDLSLPSGRRQRAARAARGIGAGAEPDAEKAAVLGPTIPSNICYLGGLPGLRRRRAAAGGRTRTRASTTT